MANKGVMIGGVFRTFDEIRKATNETAKIWRGHSTFGETILALLDHITAMEQDKAQAQRRAFDNGANWHANLTEGPYNAQAEAAQRYPDTAPAPASGQADSKPQVTRAQIDDEIESCITDDFYQSVDKELLSARIMELFGAQDA